MEILNMEQDYVLCPEYVENIFSSPLKKTLTRGSDKIKK